VPKTQHTKYQQDKNTTNIQLSDYEQSVYAHEQLEILRL